MPRRVNKDQDLVAAKKNAVRVIWHSVPGYGKPRRNTAKRSAISLINRQKPRFPRATSSAASTNAAASVANAHGIKWKSGFLHSSPRHQS